MGRELRRVPPNWEHPRQKCEHSPWRGGCEDAKNNGGMCFRPLFDESFEAAAKEWKEGFAAWERDKTENLEFWEYEGGPPDREYYRPAWTHQDATWFQVYETVSEGTPVTPAFPTRDTLIEYLISNGDFWEQHRAREERRPVRGWSRAAAENFVNDSGWSPSIVFSPERGVQEGYEAIAETKVPPK